jgi:hypothetical protein
MLPPPSLTAEIIPLAEYERRQTASPATLLPASAARQMRLEMHLRQQAVRAYQFVASLE